jgi:poly-gamma-glutamate synthesis protein (capsule biosynthesis protein)
MKLFLGGDLAWPAADCVAVEELQALCAEGRMVVNLEGSLLTGLAEHSAVHNEYRFNLYSDVSVLDTFARLNVVACGLANNHISDYVGGISHTKATLQARDTALFGSRELPWCEFNLDGQQYVLFGACSPLPDPRLDRREDQALLFEPATTLHTLTQLRARFPSGKLIALMHWGYELARYPQPADREWARQAIDAGVDLVVGHHPHLVQGLESHGSGLIAYSLGNLLLPQTDYRGRVLRYHSDEVCAQLVLELGGEAVQAHWMHYDKGSRRLCYDGTAPAAIDPELCRRTPFAGMDDAAYRAWFARTGRLGSAGKRARTVFWTYRGWGRVDSAIKLFLLRVRAALRKAAIASGLYLPYNW